MGTTFCTAILKTWMLKVWHACSGCPSINMRLQELLLNLPVIFAHFNDDVSQTWCFWSASFHVESNNCGGKVCQRLLRLKTWPYAYFLHTTHDVVLKVYRKCDKKPCLWILLASFHASKFPGRRQEVCNLHLHKGQQYRCMMRRCITWHNYHGEPGASGYQKGSQ